VRSVGSRGRRTGAQPRGRAASPLHAARASIGAAWCLALSTVALATEHPLLLAASLAAIAGAAGAGGVWRPLARQLAWGVPFALVIAVVNALVERRGATLLVRGVDLPWLGPLDITLQALLYGGLLALRALAIIGCAGLLSATIDADELLRALRRASLRSGVTIALAARLGPVLARDARRLADAQRCLPGARASRVTVLRAVTAGALDRATDVAATLEVRGFGSARRPPRARRAWSRHDLAFAASALALAALGIAAAAGGWAAVHDSPRFSAPVASTTALAGAALVVCALAPFADRRGIG
jgi:energy-coupling factor transport system permease protein